MLQFKPRSPSHLIAFVFVAVAALGALVRPAFSADYTGELAIGLRTDTGKPESMRFRYSFGEYESARSLADETTALRLLIESLPEEPSEVPHIVPHIVDVFTEDSPQGLAKAERMVARLRGITRRLSSSHGERARRIEFLVVPVPKKIAVLETAAQGAAAASEEVIPGVRAAIKRAISKPTAFDARTGAIIGTFGGVISFTTWFATPGINPLLATGLATYQTALSTFHATFSKSVSNVFMINARKPGVPIRMSTLYARRIGYGIVLMELTRMMAGTAPGAPSMWSAAGQAQIAAMTIGFGVLDTLVITARDKAFMNQPARFAYGYLASYLLLSPWTLADFAGTFPVLIDLTIYQVRASTFGFLATYLGIYQAFTRAPEKSGRVLDAVIGPVDRLVARAQRSIGKSCKTLFGRAQDYGDDFSDFVR